MTALSVSELSSLECLEWPGLAAVTVQTVVPKSPKASVWRSRSPMFAISKHAKARKQQQQQQQPLTTRINSSSPSPADMADHKKHFELLESSTDDTTNAAFSAGGSGEQQQQQQPHGNLLGAEAATPGSSTGTFSRPHPAGRLVTYGSRQADESAPFRSGHSTNGTSSTQSNSIFASSDAAYSNLGNRAAPCSQAGKVPSAQRQVSSWHSGVTMACDSRGCTTQGEQQQQHVCNCNLLHLSMHSWYSCMS